MQEKTMENGNDFCNKIGNQLAELGKWKVWQNIILGQILSLLLVISNTILHHVNTPPINVLPTGQNFPHYMFLCSVYTSWLAFRRGDHGLISIIKARGWRYLLLCLIDVQANTLLSTAHQFTTLTCVQLLGCVAIPVALALSCLVLGVRFRMVHIIAVSICLIGVGGLVLANIDDKKMDGKNQLVGDMLCLGGAVLFAIVTVLQELSVKNTDVVEYLGLLGLFGSVVSGIQMLLLEKQTILNTSWSDASVLLGTLTLCQFIYCTLSSIFLLYMGNTALHLSLLTGNYYTLMIGMLLFNYKLHALYFLSFVLTMTGVFIYSIRQTPIGSHSRRYTQNNRSECQIREHIISTSPENTSEMVSTFSTMNSGDTFPLSLSTNTTFTSFYGSHDVLNNSYITTTT
ncbi:solute carrier family 35 member F2-like [Onthophagus taurus]|uniref:solute carrier family 35 member F2-like n=1 Tax=Onthophagus taurus TaxID=166361 RepID=UPI0039BEBD10